MYFIPSIPNISACNPYKNWSIFFLFFKFSSIFFLMFIHFWETAPAGEGQRGRHRIWSRLQALSCWHRAQCWARTHELWDHDLSWSQTLNLLNHPGAPILNFLWGKSFILFSLRSVTEAYLCICFLFCCCCLEHIPVFLHLLCLSVLISAH